MYGDLEGHMGWKAAGDQVIPIKGNDQTTWWGYRLIAPMC